MKKQQPPMPIMPPTLPVCETLSDIRSQCVAKRAMEIAVTGGLSIYLVGPRCTGKSSLIAAFSHIAEKASVWMPATYEARECPCGAGRCGTKECVCSDKAKERWNRRLAVAIGRVAMWAEVPEVPYRELSGPAMGEHEDAVIARVVRARADMAMSPIPEQWGHEHATASALRTEEMAVRRLALSPAELKSLRQVARVIAIMGGAVKVDGKHVAEAAQYRAWTR